MHGRKSGVDISRLDRQFRMILNTIDDMYKDIFSTECVITSTYEGTHMPSSLHYANRAIDIRRVPGNTELFRSRLLSAIGDIAYDIVIEKDHIHIEYDILGK